MAWKFLKVDTLQVLSHYSQPSFSASLAEDFQEVKGHQAHDDKCNNFQEINAPSEALALVTEVSKPKTLVLCHFRIIVNFACLGASGASHC